MRESPSVICVNLGGNRCEDGIDQGVWIGNPGIDEKGAHVRHPESVCPRRESRSARLGAQHQIRMRVEQFNHRGVEGGKPGGRWSAGT